MKKMKKIIAIVSVMLCFISNFNMTSYAYEEISSTQVFTNHMTIGVKYLRSEIVPYEGWVNYKTNKSVETADILEEINNYEINADISAIVSCIEQIKYDESIYNNDDLANYLLLKSLQDQVMTIRLTSVQNLDGGFGLACSIS